MAVVGAQDLRWIRKPQRYILKERRVILETDPFTSLSDLRHGAGAAELALNPEENFRFTVRVDFAFQNPFDQCGILLYAHRKKIAVCCTKLHTDAVDELECIVFHDGLGDRSARSVGTAIRWMYYRVWVRRRHVRIQYSFNGNVYSDVREFRLPEPVGRLQAGIYACSPGDSSFNCTFSGMELD